MTVHVAMLPAAIPAIAEGEDRTIEYEDDTRGEGRLEFQYSLHDSGALLVWRISSESRPVVEVAYGPSSWESVQGTQREPRR